jgi:MYXO-CTERM domain-containing protein
MRSIQLVLVAFLLPTTALAAPLTQGPDPQHINGGAEVEVCGWPTAVAVSGGGGLCTGTLIHPQVVVYAAHCGGGSKSIRFVESLNGFGQTINAECLTNPEWAGNQSNDYAFCVLEAPVDLPTTPAVYGCELEILSGGREIAIVGFGNNDPGETGAGTKRWGETQIGFVDELVMTISGGTSVCSGDSGGPAFVQYPDGTWHAFAIASTVTGGCGGAGTYGLIHNAIPFIEQESGIDVTPCHTVDGEWDPNPNCQGFFAGDGSTGHGSWSDWCEGTPVGESSATCGDAFDSVPDGDAPTTSITMPMNLEYFDVGAFPGIIAITADDAEGWGVRAVRIRINGEEQDFADELAPFEFSNVNFPQGQWELVAIAEDWAGNLGESEPVLIGIGEEPIPPEPMTSSSSSESGDASESSGDTGDEDDDGSTGEVGMNTPEESGCGCRSTRGGGMWTLLLLGLLGVRSRRGGRRTSATRRACYRRYGW